MDRLLLIPEKNCQPLSIVNTGFFNVIFVEAIFQKPHIFERRMRFNAKVRGVHHAAPCCPCLSSIGSVSIARFTHIGGIGGHTQALKGQAIA